MVIEKIGNIHNIYEPKKTRSAEKTAEVRFSTDSVEISSEAIKAAEDARIASMVREAPDVRMDRVMEIKARIEDGSYDRHLDENVLKLVADRLVNGLASDNS